MQAFEYKVVPAPEKGQKARGVKAGAERFALTLEMLMNELGAEGWDYVRADTLPVQERSGLTSSHTVYRNVLVFRRPVAEAEEATAPAPLQIEAPEPEPEEIAIEEETPAHPAAEGEPDAAPEPSGPDGQLQRVNL